MSYKTLFIVLILFVGDTLTTQISAQSIFPVEIKNAFNEGDSKKLALYFDQNIEILLLEKENVYSKAQAELIIKSFFSQNSPKSFIIETERKDLATIYAIAKLVTIKNDFKVFIAYKIVAKKPIVNQMIISKVQKTY